MKQNTSNSDEHRMNEFLSRFENGCKGLSFNKEQSERLLNSLIPCTIASGYNPFKQGYEKALDDMNGKMTIYKGDPELDAIYNEGFKDALDDVEKAIDELEKEDGFLDSSEGYEYDVTNKLRIKIAKLAKDKEK